MSIEIVQLFFQKCNNVSVGKLLKGIGNSKEIKKFYDDWSNTYDLTLKEWGYIAPSHSTRILKKKLTKKPKYLLDLACGTGLFVEKFKKIFPKCICDGSDISKEILEISNSKGLYRNLYQTSFENKINLKNRYDLVSLIGAMTYCSNHNLLFKLVNSYLIKGGLFIFTQRIDLWDKLKFEDIINNQGNFKNIYKSRPINYLPKNKDFGKDIKIRIIVLQKKYR
ncbi:MAG: class I SAM-dependent DNA methyltransferase [Alphaproteobacteria bacterium]